MYEKNFIKAMDLVFHTEGGFSNHPNDRGGRTNLGVTQTTYNGWRKKKGLPHKDVINITKEEAMQLYYEEFWKPCGADKLQDPREAYAVFDMAVNSNPYNAKKVFEKSGGNIYKFLKNRKEFYENDIKKHPEQVVFKEGWMNRLKEVENNINSIIQSNFFKPEYHNEITPFDDKYNGMIKTKPHLTPEETEKYRNKYLYLKHKDQATGYATGIDTINHIFTPSEIGNMTPEEFSQNEQAIMQQLKDGLINNTPEQKDYSGYKNEVTGSSQIFSREDIGAMSKEEYAKNEKAIQSQLNTIGIPTNEELQNASQNGGGTVYVKPYKRTDGTEVRGYYRSR